MKITENKGLLKAFRITYKEFDIKGCSNIHTAKVPNDIKEGDIFNIYRGESTKEGCTWKGDLESSLKAHVESEFKMNTT